MLPTPVFLGFPYSSAGKESTCNAGDLGIRPGEFHGLYRLAKSQTRLSDFHFYSLYSGLFFESESVSC